MQVRGGFIYDEDQKAVTKSIRDRIAQVMLNQRNVKREACGEEKKEKEKLENEEQAIKIEGEDSDKEQQPAETEKEKEDKEDKESTDEPETVAPDAPVNRNNSFGGKRVIDHDMERLEGIAESSNSPHGTITDEHAVDVSHDIAAEKVRMFSFLQLFSQLIFNKLNSYPFQSCCCEDDFTPLLFHSILPFFLNVF